MQELDAIAERIRVVSKEIAEADTIKQTKERELYQLKKGMERLIQNLNEQLNGKVAEFDNEVVELIK